MRKLLRKLRYTNTIRDGNALAESIITNYSLLEMLGINWNIPFKHGTMGCVFETHDPAWIIKLTIDPYEAKLFEVIRDENTKAGFVETKEIYSTNNNTFIIVKKRIKPFNDFPSMTGYGSITTQYMNFVHTYHQEIDDVTENHKPLATAISNIDKYSFKEVADIFTSLTKLAYLGHKVVNIYLDNLGYTEKDQLVIFDAQISPLK